MNHNESESLIILVPATLNGLWLVWCQMHNGHQIYTCGCINESPALRKNKEARTIKKKNVGTARYSN